jgi:NAD(P)-dependent dehydrogenase (short-subunit alcohol dehydrogenase family)
LVANACVSISVALENTTVEDFDRRFAVNVRAVFPNALVTIGNGGGIAHPRS